MVSVGASGATTSFPKPGSRSGSMALRLPCLQRAEHEVGLVPGSTTPDRSGSMGLVEGEKQISDKHHVMAAAKAVYHLLEHHSEALIRVAVEIACDRDARKCLCWEDGWYCDHDKCEHWGNLVRSKFDVVADFAGPDKAPTASTVNFEGRGVSGLMDTAFPLQNLDGTTGGTMEIMRREQALYHQREALQELPTRSKQQQAELEPLRKLLADGRPSPDAIVNGDRSGEGEEEETICSSRSRRRPASRTGRPNSQRGSAANRLHKDAVRRAERSDKEEIERRDAHEGASGRAKSVENTGNDGPKVRNTALNKVIANAPSQDDTARKLNPIRPTQVPGAPRVMLAPPPVAKPSPRWARAPALPAQVKATRNTVDFATPAVLSMPLPVMPNNGERRRLGAAVAAAADSPSFAGDAEVADAASSSASSVAEAAASVVLQV